MNHEPINTDGLQDYLTQLAILYSKHNQCSFHEAMDVDVEDVCDYFIFIIDEDARKKQKEMLDKFSEL